MLGCNKGEDVVEINGEASGAQIVPIPVTTTASARLTGVYNEVSGMFSYRVLWDNLSDTITRINFRGPSDAGSTGTVVVEVSIPFKRDSGSIAGFTILQDAIASYLTSGKLYLLVQSKAYANGELRGQMLVQ